MFTYVIFGSYIVAAIVVVLLFKSHNQNRKVSQVELEQRIDGLIKDHLTEHDA